MIDDYDGDATTDRGLTLQIGSPILSCLRCNFPEQTVSAVFTTAQELGIAPIAHGPRGAVVALSDSTIAWIGRTGAFMGGVFSGLTHPSGPGVPVRCLGSFQPRTCAGLLAALARRDLIIL